MEQKLEEWKKTKSIRLAYEICEELCAAISAKVLAERVGKK